MRFLTCFKKWVNELIIYQNFFYLKKSLIGVKNSYLKINLYKEYQESIYFSKENIYYKVIDREAQTLLHSVFNKVLIEIPVIIKWYDLKRKTYTIKESESISKIFQSITRIYNNNSII